MSYFTDIPIISYWNRSTPNMLVRVKLDGLDVDNTAVYHPYTIKDGDRPDLISYYYYGDSNLDWLILLANNIIDLVSEWPLTSDEFFTYMTNKYTDVNSTLEMVDHYQLIPNINNISSSQYNNLTQSAQKYWSYNNNQKAFIFSAYNFTLTSTVDAYNIMQGDEQIYWQPVTTYDNEYTINEGKRHIKLIDRSFSISLQNSLQDAMQSQI